MSEESEEAGKHLSVLGQYIAIDQAGAIKKRQVGLRIRGGEDRTDHI